VGASFSLDASALDDGSALRGRGTGGEAGFVISRTRSRSRSLSLDIILKGSCFVACSPVSAFFDSGSARECCPANSKPNASAGTV
jgi:hypothetical protein